MDMSEEKNKDQNKKQDANSNPEAIGKLPLNDTILQPIDNIADIEGMPSGEGGRKGNVSVEDGGQVNGASTGSH